MKKETYFKKADELYDSIIPTQKEIREKCETFIKKALQEHNGKIDFSDCDGSVSVTYDGGNHPEYASNAFSTVQAVKLDEDKLVLETEDTDWYDTEDVETFELYGVADFINMIIQCRETEG